MYTHNSTRTSELYTLRIFSRLAFLRYFLAPNPSVTHDPDKDPDGAEPVFAVVNVNGNGNPPPPLCLSSFCKLAFGATLGKGPQLNPLGVVLGATTAGAVTPLATPGPGITGDLFN